WSSQSLCCNSGNASCCGDVLRSAYYPPPVVDGGALAAPGAFVPGPFGLYRFGGTLSSDAGSGLSDVLWRSATAAPLAPGTTTGAPPPARQGHVFRHDPGTGDLLVFGGRGADGGLLGDTWTFSVLSGEWTEHPGPGPTPRHAAASAFEPRSGRLVIH